MSEQPAAKASYIGAPACFALEMACKQVRDAFPLCLGIFIVGSALERSDFRDVDVRMIFTDSDFAALFPDVAGLDAPWWEFDARWTLLTVAISQWMRGQTGLPIDFQFQPQTWANERHDKPRNAHGLTVAKP